MSNFFVQEAIYLNDFKDFDALAVGVLDFKKNTFHTFQVDQEKRIDGKKIYFDLASVSKSLINSNLYFRFKDKVDAKTLLTLNHRSGLPAWGLLDKKTWKTQILNYEISESETLYSDFGALRFFLELEKLKIDGKKEASKLWDNEVTFWKDLPKDAICLQNGYRQGKPNVGVVHDPNAYVIDDFVSHAGLFGTIEGVCKTLLNMNKEYDLLSQMQGLLKDNNLKNRFVAGFDTVSDAETTLAGRGADLHSVFGHLGFTGTSFWIDAKKQCAHVILSNATKHFWYDKKELGYFRRNLGEEVWKGSQDILQF